MSNAQISILIVLMIGLSLGCQETDEQNQSHNQVAEEIMQVVEYQNVDAATFENMRNIPGLVVIDVRTPKEISEGKIPGAIEVNFRDSTFSDVIRAMDKDRTYVVYCAAGSRSSQAAQMMAENGFEKVHNLTGGFTAWAEAMSKSQE